MFKVDVARQYRDKFPDMPTLKLARIMHGKENQMFYSVEDARAALRAIEGKLGNTTGRVKATHKVPERPRNPYKLPASDETHYEPFILNCKRLGVVCDIHAPYHSIDALTAAIEELKKEQIDCLLINGDFFDFHGLSKYMKDPRKKNFAEELAIGVQILEVLNAELNCRIIMKWGNHDERYQHYLWQKMGELNGVEDFELENIIRKRFSPIEFVGEKRIIKAGDLNIVHGHELPSSIMSPVNIARGLYLRAKASTLCGHHHRTSEHTEQNINGHIVTTWSLGCLSELHPAYMPINSWNHGFAVVDLDGDNFYVRNKRIYNGKLL